MSNHAYVFEIAEALKLRSVVQKPQTKDTK